MPRFIHLHTHSHYSLLDGLAKVPDLVSRAKELGMEALALTDHGNLYGAVEFYQKAKKAGLKPILGVEAYLAPYGRLNKRPKIDEIRYHLTLIAKNNAGWKNLIALVTASHLEGFYYKPRIDRDILAEHREGIICLSGCPSGEIPRLIAAKKLDEAETAARWYLETFGADFFLEIQPHSPELHAPLAKLGKKLGIPLVATSDIHYTLREDKFAHEILLAVQTNGRIDDDDRFSLRNYDLAMASPDEMAASFATYPEAITATGVIADRCNVMLELGVNKLPKFPVPEPYAGANEYLEALVEERLASRFPVRTPEVEARIVMELGVIKKTGFADYFLIVQDFIAWARAHGIVVGPGRGSAAGSIVSYILGITNLDPLRYGLLFERFLNPDRVQVPDIDIDFTDTRRDEVVAYVRDKYGEDRVAQIITFGTMAARAAIRDSGRALGFPYAFCDSIAKLIPFMPLHITIDGSLAAVPDLKKRYDEEPDVQRLLDAARKLEGVARHASVHACGVVISPEPLTNFLPLQRAPQGDTTIITQFEMHSVEALGLLKMDFLGLRNLTIIERTLRLIRELRGETVDVNALPLDDQPTYELLQTGETTGVFQLESSGMRRYLKELKPSEFEDIVAMVSLYRPGPMELIPHYIKRKFKKEKVTYLHPRLEPILATTYGVGIYQEQMMRIARDLAGFTLAEADTLRKAIGKKIKSLLDEQELKLTEGMIRNGIAPETAKQIWDLFPPFARYGFNRSHAACYAMIAYQTAYLKAHYQVEFTTALLDISGTDVDRINFLIGEAKRLGIKVLPPDVNASSREFSVDNENIRFGLLAVKGLGDHVVEELIAERGRGGPYADLSNFLTRIQHRDLNKKSLEALVKCGAFDSLGVERGQALANIEDLVRFNQAVKRAGTASQSNLFGGTNVVTATLRMKPATPATKRECLLWEKELLGLYITDHPLSEHMPRLKEAKVAPIKEVVAGAKASPQTNGRGPQVRLAGVVSTVQRFTTKKGDPMLFVQLEDQNDRIEALVFADTLAKYPVAWEPNKVMLVSGRMSWKDNEPKLICDGVREL
ncbi:MAG: DNA polymerase III subunit alpha [bacterium]|nr:DNA polymerase III subunit alpha [bacterium]